MCYDVSSTTAQEKVPFSHLSTLGRGVVVETTMEELAQRLQQLETQVGQQRAVIEHQQDQLTHQQTTIDADRAARTLVTPLAQEARCNSKMRQYISAVDEELYVGLVDVEANPLRELPMTGMNEAQKKRARQLAFMLTLHTKDRALQMMTKLTDPTNGFVICRRFLEEWEPAHKGRFRAMLVQLLQFPFTKDRGQALEERERLVRQYEAQSSDTLQDTIKAAILTGPRMAQARWTERDEAALRSEWKAVHQAYRR